MADSLLGVETEYAFRAFGARGTIDPAVAVNQLLELARQTLPHLPDAGSIGMYLQNGARFYIDTGRHPELTTPECADPLEVVRYVLAGDRILGALAERLAAQSPSIKDVLVSRCNVDYGGARTTWGCHESYLHQADPKLLSRQIIPHLVSRLVYSGAGGFNNLSGGVDFTLSPRVPHLAQTVSGDSTHGRGIFHTKQEALSKHYRRLHLLCGESVCSETTGWLKLGTTALVVSMVDGGLTPGDAVQLRSPLDAIRTFARDPSCTATVGTTDGRRLGALEIQWHYLAEAERHAGDACMPPWAGDVCRGWRAILERLQDAPAAVTPRLDWAIKLALFRDRAARRGLAWESVAHWTSIVDRLGLALTRSGYQGPPVRAETVLGTTSPIAGEVEALTPFLHQHGLAWEGLRPFLGLRDELFEVDLRFSQLGERGIFAALDRAGVLEHHVPGVDRIEAAVEQPPAIGRARLRGEAVAQLSRRGGHSIADWQGVNDFDGERMLDLSDPFARVPDWQPWPPSQQPLDLLARARRLVGRV